MPEPPSPAVAPVGNALFISHNAADRPFAVALQQALQELAGSLDRIDIRFSTSEQSGPQGGDKWRDWIYRQVVEARSALIVVSPHALAKPWLLWEAGACRGAALAQLAAAGATVGTLGNRQIVSIAYGLSDQACPDPLRGDQIVPGDDAGRMRALFKRVLRAFGIAGDDLVDAVERMPEVMPRYLAAVRAAMLRAPSLVNEANIQDWLARLDALVRGDRLSELDGYVRWMTLAFGRDVDGEIDPAAAPIDVRLHRRLGELYLARRQLRPAIEQLRLAWRLAPRDIYVLRPLVEASMKRLLQADAGDDAVLRSDLETQLAAVRELDSRAYEANPDAAAQYAKYLRRVKNQAGQALEVLLAGLRATPDSYYLADLIAQAQLEMGRIDEARASHGQALSIIESLDERNLWTHATAAAACVTLGRPADARTHLLALRELAEPPSQAQLETIASSLREVGKRVGTADAELAALLSVLSPQRSASAV